MIARLQRDEVDAMPYLLWNAFIGVIVAEDAISDPIQRPAHLVFIYEGDVQNGGHHQYFENGHEIDSEETITSLRLMGADSYSTILQDATRLWLSEDRSRASTVEDFVERALEQKYAEFDNRFHECSPSLLEVLEKYFARYRDSFVQIDD